MSQELRITCFGTPQVQLAAASCSPLSRRALALFLYLAITGRAHQRDLLADLLWSEISNQQARDNLRYVLPDLRRAVGDHLLITTQTIGFHGQQPHWLDVKVLRTTLKGGLTAQSTHVWRAALALYQGEFLAGFTVRNAPVFEQWMLQQRQELHDLASYGLYTLAQHYYQEGDLAAGLATTQRLLVGEPWHEAAHRLQMQLLAASGQRTAALAQYALCRKVLADELAAEPEAATTLLYEQIRSGQHAMKTAEQSSTVIRLSQPDNPATLALRPAHNLPTPITTFFGREDEIAQLSKQLDQTTYRLLVLFGEGGVGKTRLALAVAHAIVAAERGQTAKFPHGVWFVPLADISPDGNVTEKLALAVGQAIGCQFHEQQPRLPQLLGYLRNKAMLLLFDNMEHLLPDAVDALLQILRSNPAIYALVTARRLLNLQAELGWQVTGLPLPEQTDTPCTPAHLLAYSSIALFDDRARRGNHAFRITAQNQAAVVAICRLVAGLPLAIELAAALTKYHTCAEIYAALQRDYTILTTTLRDLPLRQRSMKAVFDDAWQCLSQAEAQALAACALFTADFTRQAAAAAGIKMTTLATLVDHSLLQVCNGRFSMHKLTHQYAASRLAQS